MNGTITPSQPKYTAVKILAGIAAGMISAITLLVMLELCLRAAGAILVIADPIENADAALILSGGDDTRIDEAAILFQENLIDFVILTETGVQVPEWSTEYSNLMRFTAIQKGIPANAILITEQHVDSTIDEARASLKLLRHRGLKSLIVITDPYHTLRTRLIFKQVFEKEEIQIIIHPTTNHWYKSKTWWLSAQGWKITVQEYIKLLGYLVGIK